MGKYCLLSIGPLWGPQGILKLKISKKIAFRTYYRYFEYLIMFFELTNAPVTFQAFINNVLK